MFSSHAARLRCNSAPLMPTLIAVASLVPMRWANDLRPSIDLRSATLWPMKPSCNGMNLCWIDLMTLSTNGLRSGEYGGAIL